MRTYVVISALLALLLAMASAQTEGPHIPSSAAPSAEAAANAAIARVRAIDPQIHAVIALDPTAIVQARAIDRGRRARGPLYGYAILLKDNRTPRVPPAGRRDRPYLRW